MTKQQHIKAGNVTFGNDLPFAFIASLCQMEFKSRPFAAQPIFASFVKAAKEHHASSNAEGRGKQKAS